MKGKTRRGYVNLGVRLKVNIEQDTDAQSIRKLLKKARLKRGDTLVLQSARPYPDAVIFGILTLIAISIYSFIPPSRRKKNFSPENLLEQLNELDSPEALEQYMKKQFGIEIEQKSGSNDPERDQWLALSSQRLQDSYDDLVEPEYTLSMVSEPNPEYKNWKKGK